jgi:hypothetical protein
VPARAEQRCGLNPGEILGDRSDLLIGETSRYGAHDMCAVVAARSALEVRQLLHDVGLRLTGKTRITFRACDPYTDTPTLLTHVSMRPNSRIAVSAMACT